MADLTGPVFNVCPPEQVRDIVRTMQTEHLSITDALTKAPSRPSLTSSSRDGIDSDVPAAKRKVETVEDLKNLQKGGGNGASLNLSDQRIKQLEMDVDTCVSSMKELCNQAKAIPRMVAALASAQGKELPSAMPPAAIAAIGNAVTPLSPLQD